MVQTQPGLNVTWSIHQRAKGGRHANNLGHSEKVLRFRLKVTESVCPHFDEDETQ